LPEPRARTDAVNIVNMVEVVEVGIMLPAVCGRIPR
jgi:hypothetical protein